MVTPTWWRVNAVAPVAPGAPRIRRSCGTTLAGMDEHATALDVAAAIRAMDVSPLEVLDACLQRVDERNPALNAVIWRNDDDARSEAKRLGDRIAVGADDFLPSPGCHCPSRTSSPWPGSP